MKYKRMEKNWKEKKALDILTKCTYIFWEPLSIFLIQFMWQHEQHSETSVVEKYDSFNRKNAKKHQHSQMKKKIILELHERNAANELRFDCPSYNGMLFFIHVHNLLLQFYLTSRLLNYIIIIMTNVPRHRK